MAEGLGHGVAEGEELDQDDAIHLVNRVDVYPVSVKVEKLNPSVELVYYGTHELSATGEEITALRFSLDDVGNVSSVSRLPKPLLLRAVRTRRGKG